MNKHVTARKTVRVFRNGRSRAVRIPKEFDFEGDKVEMAKDNLGNIVMRPIKSKAALLALLASFEPLAEEDWLPKIDDGDLLPLDEGGF